MEIWANIVLNEKLLRYQISNFGNCNSFIRRYPQTLKHRKTDDGYVQYVLYDNGIKIPYMAHRLVAIAFIPNPENKLFVNHKDGNKSNNHIENLEWCTGSENCIHAIKNGLYIVQKGALNSRSQKVGQYLNDELINSFESLKEAERNGFPHSNIVNSIKRNGTAYGFKWKFLKEVSK